jgi:hypothetical protein
MQQHCWELARELLRGLERGDLALIERRLTPLRQTLAVRRCVTASAAEQLLWVEQLDLLEGITECVEASIEGLRSSTETHLAQMYTAESLLRHLVEDRAGQCALPVC